MEYIVPIVCILCLAVGLFGVVLVVRAIRKGNRPVMETDIEGGLRLTALSELLERLADTLDLRGYDVSVESMVNNRAQYKLTLHIGWQCTDEVAELVRVSGK